MLGRTFVVAMVLAVTLGAARDTEAQFAGGWSLQLGEWRAREGQMRAPGGSDAHLEIVMRGDSAIATFTPEGAPALELTGLVRGSTITLVGRRESRINRDGAETPVTLTMELELTATAGGATGEMRMLNSTELLAVRTVEGRRRIP